MESRDEGGCEENVSLVSLEILRVRGDGALARTSII